MGYCQSHFGIFAKRNLAVPTCGDCVCICLRDLRFVRSLRNLPCKNRIAIIDLSKISLECLTQCSTQSRSFQLFLCFCFCYVFIYTYYLTNSFFRSAIQIIQIVTGCTCISSPAAAPTQIRSPVFPEVTLPVL